MKKRLALALAICAAAPLQASPARTLAELQGETAYVTGRCFNYMSEPGIIGVHQFINSQEADFKAFLLKLYYQGIQDSRVKALTEEQCEGLLANLQADMRRLSG